MSTPKPDERIGQVAEQCAVPVPAVEMALNCLSWTAHNPDAVDGHLSASDFCRTFLESVMDSHRENSEATLQKWKIQSSEDLGRIVYALIAIGLAKPAEKDRPQDFDNVFDLRKQYFAWNPESDADRLQREERETNAVFRVMMMLGVLLAVGCFVGAIWVEPRIPLILCGLGAFMVPTALYLFVMDGYRRVRSQSPPSSR